MAIDPSTSEGGLRDLDREEMEMLLDITPIGRIGFEFAGAPMMLPVAYRYVEGKIVFRTAAGLKLHGVAANRPVAFEIDGWDTNDYSGWSVLVTGPATEITDFEEVRWIERLEIGSWETERQLDRWVQIEPEHMTGRRLLPAAE